MHHFNRIKKSIAASFLLAVLLLGCNFTDSSKEPPLKVYLTSPPETLMVGSSYNFRYSFYNGVGPFTIRVTVSDSLIHTYQITSDPYADEFQWNMRNRVDTVRISVTGANGGDTIIRVYHPAFATGFAPIASMEVRRYSYSSSICCSSTSGSHSQGEITLTPLGPFAEGFRFEIKQFGTTRSHSGQTEYPEVPYNETDTIHLKMEGNRVVMRNDETWEPVNRIAYPYFVQDTIADLNAEATRTNAVGNIGRDPIGRGASYGMGVGLLDFVYIYGIQMRGSSGIRITRL